LLRPSTPPTIADLYLAFRQAKTSLYFEKRGVRLLQLAAYEQELPKNLKALQGKLAKRPWFDKLKIGETWLVPKKLRANDDGNDGIVRIGASQKTAAGRSVDIQLRLSPHPEFAIVEVLYLWRFGGLLDALLSNEVLGRTRIECRFEGETVWLTQAMVAELFQTTLQNINLHLQNIYEEGELDPGATIKSHMIVRTEGTRQVRRTVQHYNFEAILAIGFRVHSHRGTQFRKWANARLSEYLVKGFTMDDERHWAATGTRLPRSSTSGPTARGPSWACRRRGLEAWFARPTRRSRRTT
jgi:hypothetical protein